MVFEKVREIISDQFGKKPEEITENTHFINDLGADSLDVVELAVSIEEAFSLPEIENDDLTAIQTVADLVAYVERVKG